MFETHVTADVLQVSRPATNWLSTGWNGGLERADAVYNITVPEGWDRTDLDTYIDERLTQAGFGARGPALLTGVAMRHARGARLDSVVAYATAGLSNPASLPIPSTGETRPKRARDTDAYTEGEHGSGTVNVIVGTTRQLSDAGRANLLALVAETKAATLLDSASVTGTTTDAIVVGDNPTGEKATFTGSATPVGDAARACVREAVRASLASRYATRALSDVIDDAEYGAVADRRAEVFTLETHS